MREKRICAMAQHCVNPLCSHRKPHYYLRNECSCDICSYYYRLPDNIKTGIYKDQPGPCEPYIQKEIILKLYDNDFLI